jgi:hypothetical protein
LERTAGRLIPIYQEAALSRAPERCNPLGFPVVLFGLQEEETMRHLSATLLLVLSVATLTSSASTAQIQDRYCLQGRSWGYPGNCQFSTYQQCMATASGTDAYCGINPMHAFARQQGGYRSHHHHGYRPY